MRAAEKLAAQNEILLHQNKSLSKTLVQEKRRRKRGKAIGLLDKDRPSELQFFSPTRVAAVRERAYEIEIENQRQKALADETRLQKAIQKDEKAREAQEKKDARAAAREAAKELRARKKEEKAAQREAKKQA